MGWPYQQKPPIGWPIDWDEPINQGLVGYYPMLVGSGNTVNNLSRNAGASTIVGAEWNVGSGGSCLLFDSQNDYINTSVSLTTRNFTIICCYDEGNTENFCLWQAQEGAGAPYKYALLEMQTDDDLTLYTGDGTNYDALIISDAVGVGNWNKKNTVAITIDGAGLAKGYVNGVLKGQDTLVEVETTWTLRLGSDEYIPAKMKCFYYLVYNRALSASEIALLYREPFCMFKDPAEIALLAAYTAGAPPGIPIFRRRRAG